MINILKKKEIKNDKTLLKESKNRSYQRNQEIFDVLAKVLKWIICIVPTILGAYLLAIMIYLFCIDIDKLITLGGKAYTLILTAVAALFIEEKYRLRK